VDPILIVVIVVVALAAVWFLFLRKKEEPALPEAEQSRPLPPKAADKPPAAAKAPEKKEEKRAPEKATPPSPPPSEKAKPAPPPVAAPEEEEEEEEVPVEVEPARGAAPKAQAPLSRRAKDVAGLRKGLTRARESEGFFGRLKAVFAGKKEIDPQLVEQIEEVLLTSDVGVKTTEGLVSSIRESLSKGDLKSEDKVWDALRAKAREVVDIGGGGIALSASPTVVMVVGVNGSGKTTTIGKLATRLTGEGKKVVLAAGDTFRAAAVQQLVAWSKRAGCEIVTGADGANAGAVLFDAVQKAKEIGADVVLADTAGRLHTKTNLMEELKKIARTMGKALDGAPHETLLVLDATNGQNATQQAALFKEALPLSGIVLTKLDGTAKGGVVLGICAEHQIPIRYIGVGERPDDLRDFNAEEFVEALLGNGTESEEKAV
jgi:fused signal recognition particle receptor